MFIPLVMSTFFIYNHVLYQIHEILASFLSCVLIPPPMKILFLLALLATVSNALVNSAIGDCSGK